jgi:hypothetical protein
MSIQHEGDFLSLNEEILESVTGGMDPHSETSQGNSSNNNFARDIKTLGRTSSGNLVYAYKEETMNENATTELDLQMVEGAHEKEQKTNKDHCMLNVLSEEQLQEIQGGSEEEKMKVLSSPFKLGGTSSWLKTTEFADNLNRLVVGASSTAAQNNISEAIKDIQSGNAEGAQNKLNIASRAFEHGKRTADTVWEGYRAEQMQRRRWW